MKTNYCLFWQMVIVQSSFLHWLSPFSSPSPPAHFKPGRLSAFPLLEYDPRAGSLQHRHSSKPWDKKCGAQRKNQEHSTFENLFLPCLQINTRQIKNQLFNYGLLLPFLNERMRQRNDLFHRHGEGNTTRTCRSGVGFEKNRKEPYI